MIIFKITRKLFVSEIAGRVKAFKAAHPEAEVIQSGDWGCDKAFSSICYKGFTPGGRGKGGE